MAEFLDGVEEDQRRFPGRRTAVTRPRLKTFPRGLAVSRPLLLTAVGLAVVVLTGIGWRLWRGDSCAAVPHELTDSLYGHWEVVESRGGPPTLDDPEDLNGSTRPGNRSDLLVLERSGYGAVTTGPDGDFLLPFSFTVDNPRRPTVIHVEDPRSERAVSHTIASLSDLSLVLRRPFTRVAITLAGERKEEELFQTLVLEKRQEDVSARSPRVLRGLRERGAVVLLDDEGEVAYVDLYSDAYRVAMSPTTPQPDQLDRLDESALRFVADCPSIRTLKIVLVRVSDDSLAHVQHLGKLEHHEGCTPKPVSSFSARLSRAKADSEERRRIYA